MFYMTKEMVAQRMQYFLESRGTTPYKLDRAGMFPKTTLYAILGGERKATGEAVRKFCRALEITFDDFYCDSADITVYTEEQEQLIEIIRVCNSRQVSEILAYANTVMTGKGIDGGYA